MGISRLQSNVGRIFRQRCFYLFVSLIVLIAVAPFAAESTNGRLAIQCVQVLVLIAAVAAVGRTPMPFVIALLLGIPPLVLQFLSAAGYDEVGQVAIVTAAFYLAFFVVAIGYLLIYVFSAAVMTDDKLFGAASAYLMLGIVWAYAYLVAQHLNPAAFGVAKGAKPRYFFDLLYMSFGVLTSNGPGDVVVTSAKVKALVIMEQVTGTLFVAILIARLAGIYPAKGSGDA
jgi:Ion channel